MGSTILNASLSVYVVGTDANDTVQVHQMLSSWSEASTWNSLVSGIQANNSEASSTVLQTINAGQAGWVTITGITSVVQGWANGAQTTVLRSSVAMPTVGPSTHPSSAPLRFVPI